jgi:hypothetical protein
MEKEQGTQRSLQLVQRLISQQQSKRLEEFEKTLKEREVEHAKLLAEAKARHDQQLAKEAEQVE